MNSTTVPGDPLRPQTAGTTMHMGAAMARPAAATAVSWAAIFAGALGAAALSLILLVLGVGLGLSSVSPWSAQGISAATFGVGTIVWIMVVALIASGVGGYLAGRLRSGWVDVHTDEVYFRDTAHGFLAWAVATLLTAALLGSTIGSILGTGVKAGSAALGAAGSAATTAATAAATVGAGAVAGQGGKSDSGSSLIDHFSDALFRPNPAAAQASAASSMPAMMGATGMTGATGAMDQQRMAAASGTPADVARIFSRSLSTGTLAPDDSRYVAQMIAQRTGMTQQDAEKRVADTYAQARQAAQDAEAKAREAADKARKATAYGSLWLFVSLLLGAFISSLMATFGGRRRDTP